jgi:predicted small secreted protein
VKRRIARNVHRARVVFVVVVLSAWVLAAAGCYTVQGVGRDITAVGEAGEDFLQQGG